MCVVVVVFIVECVVIIIGIIIGIIIIIMGIINVVVIVRDCFVCDYFFDLSYVFGRRFGDFDLSGMCVYCRFNGFCI